MILCLFGFCCVFTELFQQFFTARSERLEPIYQRQILIVKQAEQTAHLLGILLRKDAKRLVRVVHASLKQIIGLAERLFQHSCKVLCLNVPVLLKMLYCDPFVFLVFPILGEITLITCKDFSNSHVRRLLFICHIAAGKAFRGLSHIVATLSLFLDTKYSLYYFVFDFPV